MKHTGPIFPLLLMAIFILACGSLPATATSNAPDFEPLTITGTYELHSDLQAGEAFTYNSEKIDMTAAFTVTSQSEDTLKGTAQVTYIEAHQFQYNEEGFEPCNLEWTTEPITWTTELTGKMQRNTDGSLTVVLLSNPKDGPSFTQNFNCEREESKTPEFPFVAGVLVDGEYRFKTGYQLHPMLVGSREETIVMQIVP